MRRPTQGLNYSGKTCIGLEEEISPRQVNSVNITWWRVDVLVTR